MRNFSIFLGTNQDKPLVTVAALAVDRDSGEVVKHFVAEIDRSGRCKSLMNLKDVTHISDETNLELENCNPELLPDIWAAMIKEGNIERFYLNDIIGGDMFSLDFLMKLSISSGKLKEPSSIPIMCPQDIGKLLTAFKVMPFSKTVSSEDISLKLLSDVYFMDAVEKMFNEFRSIAAPDGTFTYALRNTSGSFH